MFLPLGLPGGLPALPGGLPLRGAEPPAIESSSCSRASIWDLMEMIFWSWAEDRSFRFVMAEWLNLLRVEVNL